MLQSMDAEGWVHGRYIFVQSLSIMAWQTFIWAMFRFPYGVGLFIFGLAAPIPDQGTALLMCWL
jgi:hypothetical protein